MAVSGIKKFVQATAALAAILGLLMLLFSLSLLSFDFDSEILPYIDYIMAGLLLLIAIRLLVFSWRSWNRLTPSIIRGCTSFLAVLSFLILSHQLNDHPNFGLHVDDVKHMWATLIILVSVFVAHRSASYWLIRSLPTPVSTGN